MERAVHIMSWTGLPREISQQCKQPILCRLLQDILICLSFGGSQIKEKTHHEIRTRECACTAAQID